MKIALCFSGNIRDINETKNFWIDLIKEYDMDVYASFWDVENEEKGDTLNNFLKIYTPKKYEVENYRIYKETTQDIASLHIQSPKVIMEHLRKSSKAFGQLPMYYKVWRCNMLSKHLGIDYDIVIRARTDIVLDDKFKIEKNKSLNVPMGWMMVPALPNSDGINDCFAYGIPKVMDYYALNYMMITRVWKDSPNEIYNKFISNPTELIKWSDEQTFNPVKFGSFKKDSIKDDFIV